MSEGEDGRPCIKWRRKEDERKSQKKAEERGVSEGEEYLSEGEDRRPCINLKERKTGTTRENKLKYCT